MLIQCQTCKGLLRLDSAAVSEDGIRRIRCPRCGAEGFIDPLESVGDRDEQIGLDLELNERAVVRDKCQKQGLLGRDDERNVQGIVCDPALEPEVIRNVQKPSRGVSRLLSIRWRNWAIASLVVMVFFALLVNLILPGPTGHKFFRELTIQSNDTGSGRAFENRR